MDHEVVAHPDAVVALGLGLEGECHSGVPADVPQLHLSTIQVGRHQLIAIQADPCDGQLRGPVLVDRDHVRQRARLDHPPSRIVEHG